MTNNNLWRFTAFNREGCWVLEWFRGASGFQQEGDRDR